MNLLLYSLFYFIDLNIQTSTIVVLSGVSMSFHIKKNENLHFSYYYHFSYTWAHAFFIYILE